MVKKVSLYPHLRKEDKEGRRLEARAETYMCVDCKISFIKIAGSFNGTTAEKILCDDDLYYIWYKISDRGLLQCNYKM